MFKLDTEQNMIREMEQAKLKEFKEFVQIFDEATVVLQDKHTQLCPPGYTMYNVFIVTLFTRRKHRYLGPSFAYTSTLKIIFKNG